MQHHFDSKVTKDMADIREATVHLAESTRAEDCIEALESSEQSKQAQVDRLSQRILEIEGQVAAESDSLVEARDKIATQSNSLKEKDDELATKEQDIQYLAERGESLRQQLQKRPATPLSSFRGRDHPRAAAASEDDPINEATETPEESARQFTPILSDPPPFSSESSCSPQEIVEQHLQQLGVD
ncbi:hypothetical protein NU195Hw_g8912t1 [Hortaea werneckii]